MSTEWSTLRRFITEQHQRTFYWFMWCDVINHPTMLWMQWYKEQATDRQREDRQQRHGERQWHRKRYVPSPDSLADTVDQITSQSYYRRSHDHIGIERTSNESVVQPLPKPADRRCLLANSGAAGLCASRKISQSRPLYLLPETVCMR